MPAMRHVILLSYHAFGSWLPKRRQGYFRNKDGLRASNPAAADWYRHVQHREPEDFAQHVQRVMIDGCIEAARHQTLKIYGVATDPSHLHVIAAWDDEREPRLVRRNAKQSLSRRLNAEVGRLQWFSRGGHDRRVGNRGHFLYLRDQYLPNHPGWKWDKRVGFYIADRSLTHLRST
ncbi:MAG: hypothetical protein AAGK78_05615 [Planctomycetota bacterium]